MNINLLFHVGSKNHGCEAIVRTTIKMISCNNIYLFSKNPEEDNAYFIKHESILINNQGKSLVKYSLKHCIFKVFSIILKSNHIYYNNTYKNLLKHIRFYDIYLSIGGDNYCYGEFYKELGYINKLLNNKNNKTVLFGCSIEPELLSKSEIIDDLQLYSLITARESITYDALIKSGINKNTHLFPDPAFTLDTIKLNLPIGFVENNTIGINVSPLIIDCEEKLGATMDNYIELISHIIVTTDMQIALIPHVIWENNDDRKPLHELYDKFKETGRVVMIEDHNCMELKGYISRCKMFIGARTHATIAAYSSCVPTLVVGYSVKAKGIAKDIFGTYENYVIPVQTLQNKDDLINAFEWIRKHEEDIRKHLTAFMPDYCAKAWQAGEEVRKLMD